MTSSKRRELKRRRLQRCVAMRSARAMSRDAIELRAAVEESTLRCASRPMSGNPKRDFLVAERSCELSIAVA